MIYTLNDLTVDEVRILLAGLGKLPLEVSGLLNNKVMAQVQKQEKPDLTVVESGGRADGT